MNRFVWGYKIKAEESLSRKQGEKGKTESRLRGKFKGEELEEGVKGSNSN